MFPNDHFSLKHAYMLLLRSSRLNAPRGSQKLSQIPREAEGSEDAFNHLQRQHRELTQQAVGGKEKKARVIIER